MAARRHGALWQIPRSPDSDSLGLTYSTDTEWYDISAGAHSWESWKFRVWKITFSLRYYDPSYRDKHIDLEFSRQPWEVIIVTGSRDGTESETASWHERAHMCWSPDMTAHNHRWILFFL